MYREYILNYKTALETIRKCKGINEQFNDIFSKVTSHLDIYLIHGQEEGKY